MNASRYVPSPRPTYDCPTLIQRGLVRRHIWGDAESGLVADWLYASTQKLHVLQFGLAPNRWFRHSPAYRTIFGADEVLYVLGGAMLASNPETGEVVRCGEGDSLFFSRDTWHHVRACDATPLRVVEFFAPPPATGTSGAYAAQQPYLDAPRYTRDELLGHLEAKSPETLRRVPQAALQWRIEGELQVGIIASTEHLTVALLEAPEGAQGALTAHGGDALLFGLEGELMVRTWWRDQSTTFEIGTRDAVYLPEGAAYEVLNFSGMGRALLGVAPSYLPDAKAPEATPSQ